MVRGSLYSHLTTNGIDKKFDPINNFKTSQKKPPCDTFMILISFNSNHLSTALSQSCAMPHLLATATQFPNGELHIDIPELRTVRDQIVTLMHPTDSSVHHNLAKTLIALHLLKNAGAARAIVVAPWIDYGRQDTCSTTGKAGNFRLLVDLLAAAGADELVTIEFHKPQILASLPIPIHTLSLHDAIVDHIKQHVAPKNFCIVAPDSGAHDRANRIAQALNAPLLTYTKQRTHDGTIILEAMQKDKIDAQTAIVIDDIVDTGSTALHVGKALQARGISTIFGYFVHPVLSREITGTELLSIYTKIFVSNTLAVQATGVTTALDCSEPLVCYFKKLQKD